MGMPAKIEMQKSGNLPITAPYHALMRKRFALLAFACTCCFAYQAHRSAVRRAYVDSKGWVQIVTADNRTQTIRPEKWQAGGGFEDVDLATDGRTVGWLADQMLTPLEGGTNYLYAVAVRLQIWRDGRVIRNFPAPALVIHDWVFLNNGSTVAFHVAPPRGKDALGCFLYDVNTGKELARWSLDSKDPVAPDWVRKLFAGSNAIPEKLKPVGP
jgi:hypothetical protein